MPAPNLAHQIFTGWLFVQLAVQVDALAIGNVFVAPVDVLIDGIRTYQPDLFYVSNARNRIFDGPGITGAPDMVAEILSESTRRHDLNQKLPAYINAGVREVWVVDLDARTLSIYAGNASTPAVVFTDNDTLTSDVMPGVEIELAPIFARALSVPA